MNKKSQAIIVFIMVSVMVFIIAAVLTKPLKEETTKIMNDTYLNCTSSEITKYETATCTIIDVGWFYFIGILIAVGLALVSGKRNIIGVVTAIFIFMLIAILITPLKDLVILARDSSHLDCTNAAISLGARLSCIFVDLWLFYFILIVISSAVTYIFFKTTSKQK